MSNVSYWFQYGANGVIYPYLQATSPASGGGMSVLGPYDQATASPTVVMAYTYPARYLVVNGALVEQPYFTLGATEANGAVTVTATLNNSPSPGPTTAAFTILGQTYTEALTNGVATLTFTVHPSVATSQIAVGVSATGCVSATTSIGTATQSTALQSCKDAAGAVHVTPTSKAFLSAYYALTPATIQSLLADIGTAVSLLGDISYRKVFASLRVTANLYTWATKLPANAYVPTTQDTTDVSSINFTPDELSAAAEIEATLLPNLYTKLSNAYPSGGTRQLQFADYEKDLAKSFTAFEAYMSDLAVIPNLV